MKFEADELLNLAIMSKTPYIIVEGVDDIRIYEEIAKSAQVLCEIYSVEMLEGLAGGNEGVIQAMEFIESLNMPTGKSAKEFVMGIIDCDARYYRGEMPILGSVLSLSFYSIESHFVSKFAIKPSVDQLTRISLADTVDIDSIYSNIENNIFDLYYFSLDALKNAVDPSYISVVGYSTSAGRRKDENTAAELELRKVDLDTFATNLGLKKNIESLRKFVKGKWLLNAFAEELFNEIQLLVAKCKGMTIKQCRMCELDIAGPCLYQYKEGVNKKTLYSTLQNYVNIPEFDYIRGAFKSLEVTANA
ncbi:MAG: hypothetical protein PHQ58_21415 [Rhodoferax sp.]|uniref:hypothetical protein n=1 Tax=Rhodoferax sp. TaxID=50421 RepID=UPI002636E229|nr:hypothetical protein [Rhodoferax sp.]MDD2882979.1 hypothetical protein [Rhodoferax sp.]